MHRFLFTVIDGPSRSGNACTRLHLGGRSINRDPIGEVGGLNLYALSGSDPVNGIDVLGLATPNDLAGWGLGDLVG